nr:LL-diaminopimelate aminotransferase [Parachlamydiaceae bacterium]
MTKRNENLKQLSANYLFPEINRRKQLFLEQSPHASLISLGIGDTTEPIPHSISSGLAAAASQLGTLKGYSGYGPEQGIKSLRDAIASKLYRNIVSAEDVFISDGAKCDIGRLQQLFGKEVTVAVQDPAYPVYVDGSLLQGVKQFVYLPCTPENNFWPEWDNSPRTDLIYICSPNNPTGTVATRKQLEELIALAKKNHSIIIYDAAYANYIRDPALPSSIFEIKGADEVAIEVNSFSKLAGFTGVRLGWTVIKDALKYEDGTSVKADWKRVVSTIFNGASNIAQAGGLSVLADQG